jgi:hypothetical protein
VFRAISLFLALLMAHLGRKEANFNRKALFRNELTNWGLYLIAGLLLNILSIAL